MKKGFVMVLAVLFLLPATGFAQIFKDVPENHWAYDAINKVVNAGVLSGYPDATFKGKKTLNRYQFAKAVSVILDKMEAMGDVSKYAEEIEILKKLSKEFANELRLLRGENDKLSERILALEQKVFGGRKIQAAAQPVVSGEEEEIFGEEQGEKKESAEDYATFNKFAVGANAFWYELDAFPMTGGDALYNNLIDTEVGFDGFISYTFKKDWRIAFSYGKWDTGQTGTYTATKLSSIFGTSAGFAATNTFDRITLDHDFTPLEFKVYYLIPNKNKRFQPYAGIGIGKYKVDGNIKYFTNGSTTNWVNVHFNESATGWNISLGADYFVSPDFAIRGEATYLFGDETITIGTSDITTGSSYSLTSTQVSNAASTWNAAGRKVEFDNFMLKLGIVYYFK